MKSRAPLFTFVLTLAAAMLLIAGCAKKPVAKVEPPPPPPQPTVTLSVYPQEINKGQSAKLTWESKNATDDGILPLLLLPLAYSKKPHENSATRQAARWESRSDSTWGSS